MDNVIRLFCNIMFDGNSGVVGVISSASLLISLYLTALVKRFTMICCTRVESPIRRSGIVGSISRESVSSLLSALGRAMFAAVRMISDRLYSPLTISILPDSILEKSRMSLTMSRRLRPADRMFRE